MSAPSMIPSTTYDEWSERHATIFSLTGETNAAMFVSWEPIFQSAGYTFAELDDATYFMASQAAPRFSADHLPAIQSRVRSMRSMLSHEQLQELQKKSWQLENEWEPDVKKRWAAFLKKANKEHPPARQKSRAL